jgi:hypothetical protein
MPQPADWTSMMAQHAELLEKRTGLSPAEWNAWVKRTGIKTEDGLRTWLEEQGVTGHPRNLLVRERFGYPAFLQASGDELIDGQYADRPALRPIFDALISAVDAFAGMEVQARKTKVSLQTPKRKFAEVVPTTKTRVDLFLRIDGEKAKGSLVALAPKAGEVMNLKVGLNTVDDIDGTVTAALERAFKANC